MWLFQSDDTLDEDGDDCEFVVAGEGGAGANYLVLRGEEAKNRGGGGEGGIWSRGAGKVEHVPDCERPLGRRGQVSPLLAGVLGCVCAPLALSLSSHGCAVWVCVFGLGLRLRPATPGWGVGLCACSACTQPLLAWVLGVGVCVWAAVSAAPRHSWLGRWAVWLLRLHPATPGTGARCGCVCLGSGFGCAPPLLAGVLSCVCAPLAPSPSWQGCAVWVCVCLGSGFGCAPPLLAGVLGCVRAPLAPSHSWHGWAVWVCARARVLAAPRLSWLGFVVFGLAVAWLLFVCRGSLRVVRAHQVCGTRRRSLLGTCPCALVVAGGVPLWRASWPRVVRRASSGLVALGAPVGFFVAVVPFPNPGACALGFTGRLRGARGGRPGTGLFVPAAGRRRGGGAGLAPRCTRSGPRDGVVPGGSLRRWSWVACAAVVGVCGPGH